MPTYAFTLGADVRRYYRGTVEAASPEEAEALAEARFLADRGAVDEAAEQDDELADEPGVAVMLDDDDDDAPDDGEGEDEEDEPARCGDCGDALDGDRCPSCGFVATDDDLDHPARARETGDRGGIA